MNRFAIERAGFVPSPASPEPIAVVVENGCSFFASVTYPEVVRCGERSAAGARN